jgi:capsular polysaccharide transport system permease protein
MPETPALMTSPLHEGWKAQLRVFRGLILRELHARYGRENLGFIWVILEPMILATVITLIHVGQPANSTDNDSVAAFAIIGYTIFIIFRNTFNRADGAIEMNQPLLYHRMVTIFDIIVARALMDILACYAVTVVLLSLAVVVGFADVPARPLHLIVAALLMGWFTLALTLIASCITYRNELWSRQLHVISYLTIPVSGAWFSLARLPPVFRDKLQWFPMPLIFEQARYGQFRSSPAAYVEPGYVIAWCAGLTFAGLLMTRRLRNRVHG